ncbi:aminoglycoside phosphotransferase family protein [Streptomyces kanamyceticus]|uniref:Aminoglycoside phosphotransferase family protein n=1 Tax=Streptomyces kanamyceticus TaxID=1967 RepID=A0A5J6GGM8_STRKN|nr:aminoglycoside phosphotransferase family protein [Streptomyces kanamyceticus]QEU94649.1 aminoglycoside phosphotransferase family protein [Streptomyces kanamyceticus]
MAADAAQGSEEAFTSTVATRVMVAACQAAGLDARDAELIRLGENALFRLASVPVIVRVARGTQWLPKARTEVGVSRWLTSEGFPAARVVEDLEQPLLIDGHPVTFWHLIVEGGRRATYGELGGVLRDLHSLTVPDGLQLPSFEPFDKQELRLDRAVIPEDDKVFLRKRARELRDRFAELRFETPKGPVHGDAHVQNLMVDAQGQVILIDFEAFCFDHPEWDLMVTATEHHSLGWQTDEQYADFVGAYGRDLYDWDGYETLRGLQEFGMTTWLMQNVQEDERTAAEYRRRIAGLRNDDAPRDWRPDGAW